MSVQVSVDLRFENAVYQCGVCGKLKNNKHERCRAITQIAGIAINNGTAQVSVGTMFVCPTCFESPDLKLEDPSGIVTPEFTPPKDLVQKLKTKN